MTDTAHLVQPFPRAFDPVVSNLMAMVADDRLARPLTVINVNVRGETLGVPSRLYRTERWFNNFRGSQAPFARCLLMRHHDGFARSRAVDEVIRLNEPWSIPYVVLLVGEYVAEILDQIDANFDVIDHNLLVAFFEENPAYRSLIRARVMSYWNCYYRGRGDRHTYVGFRLLRRIEDVIGAPLTAPPETPSPPR